MANVPGEHGAHEPSVAETLPAGHGSAAQGCRKPPLAEKQGEPISTPRPRVSLTTTWPDTGSTAKPASVTFSGAKNVLVTYEEDCAATAATSKTTTVPDASATITLPAAPAAPASAAISVMGEAAADMSTHVETDPMVAVLPASAVATATMVPFASATSTWSPRGVTTIATPGEPPASRVASTVGATEPSGATEPFSCSTREPEIETLSRIKTEEAAAVAITDLAVTVPSAADERGHTATATTPASTPAMASEKFAAMTTGGLTSDAEIIDEDCGGAEYAAPVTDVTSATVGSPTKAGASAGTMASQTEPVELSAMKMAPPEPAAIPTGCTRPEAETFT